MCAKYERKQVLNNQPDNMSIRRERERAVMMLLGVCVVRTVVYCLRWSVGGSELRIEMFSVYDNNLLLPVGVMCEICFCVCGCECFFLLC